MVHHAWMMRAFLASSFVVASMGIAGCSSGSGAARGSKATAGEVSGTVVGSAGKPVAGARVFNSGDGPKPVETRSDQSGHFRLEGLNPGSVYVFAEKPGHRFTGVRTTAGATGVVVALRGCEEPVPQRPDASGPVPLEQQQKLARKMLEKLWAEDVRSRRFHWVTVAMSQTDPELALRWAGEADTGCTDHVRAAMMEKVAGEDWEEALSLMDSRVPERLNALIKLAHRYATSDPGKAMRCAEELAVGGRGMDQPWRPGYLAVAGGLAIRLGNKEAGRRLLDEAGDMAARLGCEHAHAAARGMVARAMAPHDLKRALGLLEPLSSQNNREYYLANVAVAACAEDLEQALAVVAKPELAREAGDTRLRMAYRLAQTRPADAVRVAESLGSAPGVSHGKQLTAMALGWVAVGLAEHDRPQACSLIDRAFAILMAPDVSESPLVSFGGWPARAAFLAVQAQRIGYPDMESIVARVLACRPTERNAPSPARVAESKAVMAAFLGLVNPQAAREILDSVEPQRVPIGSESSEVGYGTWVKAWLLADMKRGQALFEEAATSIKDRPKSDDEFYQLIRAAELLAAQPHEKSQYILPHTEFYCPEEEW